jgi:transposase-like protein
MRRHYTAEQRGQLIDLVASGRSIREAAAHFGIGTSTASYWVRQAAAKARQVRQRDTKAGATAPAFVRLVREPEAACLELRVGGATLHVMPDFDPALLRAVVAALREDAP